MLKIIQITTSSVVKTSMNKQKRTKEVMGCKHTRKLLKRLQYRQIQNCRMLHHKQSRFEQIKLQQLEYEKRLLFNFKSDLINHMDHMRILGTEPSSMILSQIA